MTKDEINEYLTMELFGECVHEWRKFVPNPFNSLRFQCTKCLAKSALDFSPSNFFTWEGAGKVIEAMKARPRPAFVTIEDQRVFTVATFTGWDNEEDAIADTLAEAVCRAAVEFLKGEKA